MLSWEKSKLNNCNVNKSAVLMDASDRFDVSKTFARTNFPQGSHNKERAYKEQCFLIYLPLCIRYF